MVPPDCGGRHVRRSGHYWTRATSGARLAFHRRDSVVYHPGWDEGSRITETVSLGTLSDVQCVAWRTKEKSPWLI